MYVQKICECSFSHYLGVSFALFSVWDFRIRQKASIRVRFFLQSSKHDSSSILNSTIDVFIYLFLFKSNYSLEHKQRPKNNVINKNKKLFVSCKGLKLPILYLNMLKGFKMSSPNGLSSFSFQKYSVLILSRFGC